MWNYTFVSELFIGLVCLVAFSVFVLANEQGKVSDGPFAELWHDVFANVS